MEDTRGGPRELAVPSSLFVTLNQALSEEHGPDAASRLLAAAGRLEGGRAAFLLGRGSQADAASLSQSAFWLQLAAFFGRRGWGSLALSGGNRAVGLLTSPDWTEADPERGGANPSCAFTSGFLAGLLSSVAGGDVAVREVGCRSRGDGDCTFAFGSPTAVEALAGYLSDGRTLADALSAL